MSTQIVIKPLKTKLPPPQPSTWHATLGPYAGYGISPRSALDNLIGTIIDDLIAKESERIERELAQGKDAGGEGSSDER